MNNPTDKKYIYSVEMFKNVGTEENPVFDWVKDIRIYESQKQLTDDDLKDIPNKRINAKLESVEVNGAFIVPQKIDMEGYSSEAYNEAIKQMDIKVTSLDSKDFTISKGDLIIIDDDKFIVQDIQNEYGTKIICTDILKNGAKPIQISILRQIKNQP